MAIWAIWLLVAVAVLGAKYYTTRAVGEMRFLLVKHKKRLSCIRGEERSVQAGIVALKKGLSLAQKAAAEDKKLIPKLKQDLMDMEEEDRKRMQESKSLLSEANLFGGS